MEGALEEEKSQPQTTQQAGAATAAAPMRSSWYSARVLHPLPLLFLLGMRNLSSLQNMQGILMVLLVETETRPAVAEPLGTSSRTGTSPPPQRPGADSRWVGVCLVQS